MQEVNRNYFNIIKKNRITKHQLIPNANKTKHKKIHSKQLISLVSYTASVISIINSRDGLNFGNILNATEWSSQQQKNVFMPFVISYVVTYLR